jgi:hypothetical protein
MNAGGVPSQDLNRPVSPPSIRLLTTQLLPAAAADLLLLAGAWGRSFLLQLLQDKTDFGHVQSLQLRDPDSVGAVAVEGFFDQALQLRLCRKINAYKYWVLRHDSAGIYLAYGERGRCATLQFAH